MSASMFSFNHEQGACPHCRGLGTLTVCDPARLVTDATKSLVDGAMDGTKTGRFYGEPHGQYVAALMTAGRRSGFDFTIPYERLGEDARQTAMYGTGDRLYEIVWSYKRGARAGDFKFKGPWKGFVNLVNEEYERKHADDRGRAMLDLMKEDPCPACGGARLNARSLAVTFRGMTIAGLSALTAREAAAFFGDRVPSSPGKAAAAVVNAVRREILDRLDSIRDVGLDYLSMDRGTGTLSGGEAQRLRLAGELGAGLSGVTYVLDEPTVGLHPRDTGRLIAKLGNLVGQGNTVVVVEHDPDVIAAAHHVLDIGPGAGRDGGRIVAEGTPEDLRKNPESPTGRHLAARITEPPPSPAVRGLESVSPAPRPIISRESTRPSPPGPSRRLPVSPEAASRASSSMCSSPRPAWEGPLLAPRSKGSTGSIASSPWTRVYRKEDRGASPRPGPGSSTPSEACSRRPAGPESSVSTNSTSPF